MPCSACGKSQISYPATQTKPVQQKPKTESSQTPTVQGNKQFPPKVVKELPPIR